MHLFPQALPGRKAVLFAATDGSKKGSLRVLTLRDGKVSTVVENSTYGQVSAQLHGKREFVRSGKAAGLD